MAEKPSFSWDEDSDVREMLHNVFHEDEEDGVSVTQALDAVFNEEATEICSTRADVQLLEVGGSLNASNNSEKVGTEVARGSCFIGHDMLDSRKMIHWEAGMMSLLVRTPCRRIS